MSFSLVPTGGVNIPSLVTPGNTQLSAIQGGPQLTDSSGTGLPYAALVSQTVDSAGVNIAGVDSSHNQLVKVNAALPAGTNLIGSFKNVDAAGINQGGIDAFHNEYITDGGSAYVSITASSAGAVKASAGRLCKVTVLTAVTSAVTIYDNTNAASGTALLTIPTTATVATIYNVQALLTNGAYVGGGTGSPALLVTYC